MMLLAGPPPVHSAAGLGGIFVVAFLAAIWSLTGAPKDKGGKKK